MSLDSKVARKWLSLEESTQKRGIDFNLPLLSLINIYKSKKCYYTGVSLTQEVGKPNSITLDRKDNNLGYVIGNVVACAADFNHRKGSITIDDIKTLYRKLVKEG